MTVRVSLMERGGPCSVFQIVEPYEAPAVCEATVRDGGLSVCSSAWGTEGVVSMARSRQLVSPTFDSILREELPLPPLHDVHAPVNDGCATTSGEQDETRSALFGGAWFWEVYRHALFGESVHIDLGGTGVSLAEDTVATQKQLRLQCVREMQSASGCDRGVARGSDERNGQQSCDDGHALAARLLHGSAKLEVLYALALSVCMHLVNLPILEDHHGPQALILCATKDECDEMAFVLHKFATLLHLVVHNLFDLYPTIPREKRAEIVVGTPTLWESVVCWSREMTSDNLEGILVSIHGNASLPTYTSTKWRPYSLPNLAQIVLFDLEMQLNLGFGVMLRRLFTMRCRPHIHHRPGPASSGVASVDSRSGAFTTTYSSCQLYLVIGGDRSLGSATAHELSELVAAAQQSCLAALACIALGPTAADGQGRGGTPHERKRTREERTGEDGGGSVATTVPELSCGLLIHHALSNSRLHVDPTAYDELCRGVWSEMQTFWQHFEPACHTAMTAATYISAGSDNAIDCCASSGNDECGGDEHVGNMPKKANHSRSIVTDSSNIADTPSRRGMNVDTNTKDIQGVLARSFRFHLALLCTATEKRRSHVREACLLISPSNDILGTHRTRIDLLFKHLEDTLNGQLFDGSVIVCENMKDVNAAHANKDNADSGGSDSVEVKPMGSAYHIIENDLVAMPELFMHTELSNRGSTVDGMAHRAASAHMPGSAIVFITAPSASDVHTAPSPRVEDYAWNVERGRTVAAAAAAALDACTKQHAPGRVSASNERDIRDEAMSHVATQQQIAQRVLCNTVPQYAFLDDRPVSSPFTVVVLRNITRTLTELTTANRFTDSAAEPGKPFALLLLEECCQYGRVLSYFCYMTSEATAVSTIANDHAARTSLFVEFDSTDAAMEATRVFSIRFCVCTDGAAATAASHDAQFLHEHARRVKVRLFRNDTYYTGVRQQIQKKSFIESSLTDKDDVDDDDDILSDIALLDE